MINRRTIQTKIDQWAAFLQDDHFYRIEARFETCRISIYPTRSSEVEEILVPLHSFHHEGSEGPTRACRRQ